MRYQEIIEESLLGPLPYQWDHHNNKHWSASFAANGTSYTVIINSDDNFLNPETGEREQWYNLAFSLKDNIFAGVIGTDGMAFRIFATALAAFEDFIRIRKPERFIVSSSKEEGNRARLYRRLGDRFKAALISEGYHECAPPDHDLADIHKYADIMAWRRDQ